MKIQSWLKPDDDVSARKHNFSMSRRRAHEILKWSSSGFDFVTSASRDVRTLKSKEDEEKIGERVLPVNVR